MFGLSRYSVFALAKPAQNLMVGLSYLLVMAKEASAQVSSTGVSAESDSACPVSTCLMPAVASAILLGVICLACYCSNKNPSYQQLDEVPLDDQPSPATYSAHPFYT